MPKEYFPIAFPKSPPRPHYPFWTPKCGVVMVALALLALSLHIRRIYLHGVKQYDQTMKSQVVKCVKFSTTITFYDAVSSIPSLLATTADGFGAESASYRCSLSAQGEKQQAVKLCCIQTASLHPEMELWGELTRWEVDLSNYVTVDWATGYTSSCPQ